MTERGSSTSRLGNLTTPIVDTLRTSDSIPNASPKTSGIGLPTPHLVNDESETLTPSGKCGAGGRQIAPMLDIDLARASDEEVMESLTLVLGSRPEAETKHWYGEGGFDCRLTGYKLTGPANQVQIAQARAIMAAACEPLGRVEMAEQLSKLRLAVVSSLRGADLEGWMEVILEDLRDFPAAVVIGACERWRRREKYLPSSAELVEECHQLNRPRQALRCVVNGSRDVTT